MGTRNLTIVHKNGEYKDLIEVSDMFKCEFYNAGVMSNGGIYTVKVKSNCND